MFLTSSIFFLPSIYKDSPGFGAIEGANDTDVFLRQGEWLQERLPPLPATCVVNHICHAVEVAGVDHVGLGSDFDGILQRPEGLEDASRYGTVAELLLERGFAREDVRKVLGGNMQRVFAQATGAGTRAATATLAPLT